MRVHPELLGKYTVPNVADDDEGYYLVGALVQAIDAALEGRIPSRLVSYGKFLALISHSWRNAAGHQVRKF